MNSRAARWVSSWAECSTRLFENSPQLSKIAPILSMARPLDVRAGNPKSSGLYGSTGRFEEQVDRHGDRGGAHAVAAKVSETFFDADDGAASTCEAKMHEADGLSGRTPAGPRDAGRRKRHVRGGMSQRACRHGLCSLPADRAEVFQNPGRDPQTFDFRGIGVGDEAAFESVG